MELLSGLPISPGSLLFNVTEHVAHVLSKDLFIVVRRQANIRRYKGGRALPGLHKQPSSFRHECHGDGNRCHR
jgi:hypothetical protein